MLEYLQNLLKGPIVGRLGTRDENHKVFRTIFFGAFVLENPTRLVFYIPEAGMAAARKNLLIGDYAAALVVDATTFESIQIKGTVTSHTATDWEESNYKKQLGGAEYVPNVTTLSEVWYIDDFHVALSNQCYLRTETNGEIFDQMALKLAAIASFMGMEEVFQLRGADIYEVLEVEEYTEYWHEGNKS